MHASTVEISIEDLVGPLQAGMTNVIVAEEDQEQAKIQEWVKSTPAEQIGDLFVAHIKGRYKEKYTQILTFAPLLESITGLVAQKMVAGLKDAEAKVEAMLKVVSTTGKDPKEDEDDADDNDGEDMHTEDMDATDPSLKKYDRVCKVNGVKVPYNARKLLILGMPPNGENKSFMDAKRMKTMNKDVNPDVIDRYVASRSKGLLPKETGYERTMQETTFIQLANWARKGDLVIKSGPQRTVHNDRTTGNMLDHFSTNVTLAVRKFVDDKGRKRWELQDGYNTASQFGAALNLSQPGLSDEFEGFTLFIDDSGLQRCKHVRIFLDIYEGAREVVEPIIANMKKAKAQPQGNQHAWEECLERLSNEEMGPEWTQISPAERYALQMQMAADRAGAKTSKVLNGTFTYFHEEIKAEAAGFLKTFEKEEKRLNTHDVCFRYVLYTILVYHMKGSDVCHKFDDAINHVFGWFAQIVTSSGKDVLRMPAEEIEHEMAEAGKSATDWKYSLVLGAKAFRRLQNLFPVMLCLRMSNVCSDMMFVAYNEADKIDLTGTMITVFCEVAAICKWKMLWRVEGVTPEASEFLTSFPWEKFDQVSPSLDNPCYRMHVKTCARHIAAFTPTVCDSIHAIFEATGPSKAKEATSSD